MTIDENHPAVRRLVEKVAADRARSAIDEFKLWLLDGINDNPALGSLVIPPKDDAVEYARFEGWLEGIKQGHQNLLHALRWKIGDLPQPTL